MTARSWSAEDTRAMRWAPGTSLANTGFTTVHTSIHSNTDQRPKNGDKPLIRDNNMPAGNGMLPSAQAARSWEGVLITPSSLCIDTGRRARPSAKAALERQGKRATTTKEITYDEKHSKVTKSGAEYR